MNDGILLLHKPVGITSHDAVNRMRRLFGTRAVGHTGTLDPMASGLLVILIGNATKASEYAMEHTKLRLKQKKSSRNYIMVCQFGCTSMLHIKRSV